MARPTALGAPHSIFPNTLTTACEPSNTSVIKVPVSHPVAMTPIVVVLSTGPLYSLHLLLQAPMSKYAILLEIQLTLARMQAFHEFMGKASSACTTYEVTILNTSGTDLKPSVCASLIAARMLAKSESQCS